MAEFTRHEIKFLSDYHDQSLEVMHKLYPQLTMQELSYAIDEAISLNLKNPKARIDNSYKRMEVSTTLLELTQYIWDKQPIMTNYGAMFSRHGTVPNPIAKMLQSFLSERKKMKKKMFEYPKGSAEYAKYNLLQLLLKIDANGYYGVSGQYSCIYYNLYAASSVTTQGRQANATAALFFEMFMANNVPFESMEELMVFVNNVCKEERKYKDYIIGVRNIPLEECFFKLLYNCGFDWIPNEHELELVWHALSQLSQEDLNRLYYKNNLFEFCSNPFISDFIINMLCKLQEPFLDPNSPPSIIKEDLDEFLDLLREYVYYGYQIPSKLEKMDALIRDVSIIQDTDSCIISFDGWYRFILEKCAGVPMDIKTEYIDMTTEEIKEKSTVPEYDFFNDEIIEVDRLNCPIVMIPQDGLRYSIIAIIGYCTGKLLNQYVEQMCMNFGANRPEGCLVMLKNEFLFRRVLITDAKKHYASIQELQEGNKVPEDESLDVKGMEAFVKSTMNKTTQTKLKRILYEDILNTPTIDQVNIVKKIAMIEKEIYDSIRRGEKLYYKPVKIRSASSYESPMFIQGVKAAVAYNALHEPGTEGIDTTIRNNLDIIKVEITRRNVDKIAEMYPEVYQRTLELLDNEYFKGSIDAIAIPPNEPVPGWVLPFVRYAEIINDNVGNFPLESVGLYRGNPNNNTSNIVSF